MPANVTYVSVNAVDCKLPALAVPDTFAVPVIPNSVPLNVKLALSTNLPPVPANVMRVLVKLVTMTLAAFAVSDIVTLLTVNVLDPELNVKPELPTNVLLLP